MSNVKLGDFVILRGTSGYGDFERRHGLIVSERRFLGFMWKQYLCLYKVFWTDADYREEFLRWRRAGRLIKDFSQPEV